MTYSLSREKIAVVTDEKRCALKFYSDLSKSIRKHPHYKNIQIYTKQVVYHVNQPQYDQHHQRDLHELNSFVADVIIVLIQHEFIPIFLNEVFEYELISSLSLWVIPSYHNHLSRFSWFPEHVISYELEEEMKNSLLYHNLHKSLVEIQQQYRYLNKVTTR